REPLLNDFLELSRLMGKWIVVVSHDVLSKKLEEKFVVVELERVKSSGGGQ
ncbi:MAG: hypothetical protein HUK20_02895, partial [Fibrobacter sp.]|nr:hypothetical protein [Fibrobacter sp.]